MESPIPRQSAQDFRKILFGYCSISIGRSLGASPLVFSSEGVVSFTTGPRRSAPIQALDIRPAKRLSPLTSEYILFMDQLIIDALTSGLAARASGRAAQCCDDQWPRRFFFFFIIILIIITIIITSAIIVIVVIVIVVVAQGRSDNPRTFKTSLTAFD